MKSFLVRAIVFAVALTAFGKSASAIPLLQLYIEGGSYDSSEETWTATSADFKVWVIGNITGAGSKGTISHVVLAMSTVGTGTITVTPTTTSAVIDSLAIADPSTPSTPVILANEAAVATYGAHLDSGTTGHAEYSSATNHYFLGLGNFSLSDSPIADFNGDTLTAASFTANKAQINVYHVSVTGFESVHFDAFNSTSGDKHARAPFSHDSTTTPDEIIDDPVVVVPEPTSLAIALTGCLGLCGYSIRRRTAKSAA